MDFHDILPSENTFNGFGSAASDNFSDMQSGNSFNGMSDEYATGSPFGNNSMFYTPEYIRENIDFQKMILFIKSNQKALFNYKAFIGTTTVTKKHRSSFGEDAKYDAMMGIPTEYTTSSTEKAEIPAKSQENERPLKLTAKLNVKVGNVFLGTGDNQPGPLLTFLIEYEKQYATYDINFYYTEKHKILQTESRGELAFSISSQYYDDFEELLHLCNFTYRQDANNYPARVAKTFIEGIKTVSVMVDKTVYPSNFLWVDTSQESFNDTKYKYLAWLYENIPRFAALQLFTGQTFQNILKLNKYDEAGNSDTTTAVTSILSKIDFKDLYAHYAKNPKEIISLVGQLEGDDMVKNMCNYLAAATLMYSNVNPEAVRIFEIDDRKHIETNIISGDDPGKVELVNEGARRVYDWRTALLYYIVDTEINNPKKLPNQFHPLELIYIRATDPDTGEKTEFPTIALYAKYLGDQAEWNDVKDITFAAVDIISIITGGFALKKGLVGAARLLTYLDVAVSIIDLGTLTPPLKALMASTPEGKWFVAHWHIISLCTSVGSLSYYLAKGILKNGPKLLDAIKKDEMLTAKVKKLMEESENISKARRLPEAENQLDGLFRDITKNLLIKNKGVLTFKQFKKIADQIAKNFDTNLHWIDRNSEEFKELYKRWQQKPVYAVFHEYSYLNRKYKRVLDGPAIYFFNGFDKLGNKFEITAYTMQHELIHLKLFHTMNVEFKHLAGLYHRIPNMLHEAHVIGTFLKQNKFAKASKWDLFEIEEDLETLNSNIEDLEHWNKAAVKIFGKNKFTLKDFENWDLNNYFDKL